MKAIVIGDWISDVYEDALTKGFEAAGVEVIPFKTQPFFEGNRFTRFQRKIRLRFSPILYRINRLFIRLAIEQQPDFIFFFRPILIPKQSLLKLRKCLPKTKLVSYHNDNPFVNAYERFRNRLYLNALPYYHLNFVYRESNKEQAKNYGAQNVHLLMPYYIKGLHDTKLSVEKQYDVIFIGHFEPDFRADCCELLLQKGINLTIMGYHWYKVSKAYPAIRQANINFEGLWGMDYVRAIKAAKVVLVFFSSLNQDHYTRRNFEIPASGACMLSQRSAFMEELFVPDKEAAYFSSPQELYEKVKYLLEHPDHRETIAQKGQKKCLQQPYSNIDAAKRVLDILKKPLDL